MAIDVSMTSPEGVTLATSGKYCPDNVQITPQLQAKTVTPTDVDQTIIADDGYVGLSEVLVERVVDTNEFHQWRVTVTRHLEAGRFALLTDSWLKTNRAHPGLCVIVTTLTTLTDTGISFYGDTLARNTPGIETTDGQGVYQCCTRTSSSGSLPNAINGNYPLTSSGNEYGRLAIGTDGTLYRGNSTTLIQPAGVLVVTAFLLPME